MIGIEKYHTEKEMIKWLRKYLENAAQDLPVHSIHKKRNQVFAFLNFIDQAQKDLFKELYESQMMPQVKNTIRVKEIDNYKQVGSKQFKPVKSADSMLMDGEYKKSMVHKNIT